ncbi:UDP-N-acetylglucosamine--dolichyl-phosphate N-acetylglucosaminephosphotransferase isoform X1 [Amborella trichopoda]|uniref:UDP-N-acetylglucosamine--dolichyl-phosphate N-acetylglucosaminephosphotransferase isoform X1 n=1 Tax=Amborella trichopoda TaxID=13333 RepID=UPI0009BD3345|nr:UDP-N-acetylglucosamine--dolichyl-phosphate N-acetylglucosaminephosphotransferase isoform X1 [Amborella trichopoda]|eukprot:XP_020528306.1 UDP-N-acetylglucosamine--dolichyl-phosphate N-acetylglucosaminephosphotransferase isoform X1 [Amborella trichopoda]
MAASRKRSSSAKPVSHLRHEDSRSLSTNSALNSSPPPAKTTEAEPVVALAPPKLGQIFGISAICLSPYLYLLFFYYDIDAQLKWSILCNVFLSIGGFFATLFVIPVASRYLVRRNLFGYDINKKGTSQGSVKVPESLGIVIGIVYLIVTILFQHFNFEADSNWLVEYNAALASICFMILLGFVDDVLDIPWRVKLLLPSFAALPLLMAYAGHTTIIVPKPLVPYIGIDILDLGWIYKLYMGLLAVFCTNSINIHAGLNGLEVGQSIVISAAVRRFYTSIKILIHNVMQIGVSSDPEYKQAHAFSIYLVQPFIATSLALLSYNWYPSSVFVGDTYTYFAGMTMAVVGILGHFSETLLLFFLPQVLNFLYSCPQLFKIIPCPRHRLPRFDPQTRLLTGTKDWNLVNLFLNLFGRCSEKSLCIRLLVFQALACLFCFWLRYILAGWYK